jgi:quinol monooxygenase YgiN
LTTDGPGRSVSCECRALKIDTCDASADRPDVPGDEEGVRALYGLIGKILAVPGSRDELGAILLEGIAGMPGCLSYVVAHDPADSDVLWVTEVWTSADAHRASLSQPAVQEAIARGRPLIAGFGERIETRPIGGHGPGAPS